jgi:hypothetical protein
VLILKENLVVGIAEAGAFPLFLKEREREKAICPLGVARNPCMLCPNNGKC